MVDGRTRADLDGDAELVGDDVRERRLAEAGRTAQQHVLHRLASAPRSLQQDAEVFAYLLLADVLGQHARAQRQVELIVVSSRVDQSIFSAHLFPSQRLERGGQCVLRGRRRLPVDRLQAAAAPPAMRSRGCAAQPRPLSARRHRRPRQRLAAARPEPPRASSFGLRSMITLAAVRGPTPLARRIGAGSSAMIARFSTSRLAALRMLRPTFGPTPSTPMSISNSSSSSAEAEPVQRQLVLAHVCVDVQLERCPRAPAPSGECRTRR